MDSHLVWAPEGRHLIFSSERAGARNLYRQAADGTGVVERAYEADNSGRFEVYVRPFPDVNGGSWQVSTGGGMRPLWARNGQELFYLSPTGALMQVGVERGSSWTATTPSVLLKEDETYVRILVANPGRMYDISPDWPAVSHGKDGWFRGGRDTATNRRRPELVPGAEASGPHKLTGRFVRVPCDARMYEAKSRLLSLVEEAAAGHEIAKAGVPRARLVPVKSTGRRREPPAAAGMR